MQKATFTGIGKVDEPSLSTKEIVDFLLRYGATPHATLENHFSKYTAELAMSEGFVDKGTMTYHLTQTGASGQPKSLHELSEPELDYFVGRVVGKRVTLEPIIPALPEKGFHCLDTMGHPYEPSVSWVESSRLMKERGISILYPPPHQPWIAETPSVRIDAANPCIAICKCILASVHGLDETYLCDWRAEDG